MGKRRLFVGTFLPEAQRGALVPDAESAARLAEEWGRKIRWVRPDKLHLTWVFLGDVEDAVRPEVEAKLSQLLESVAPLQLTYSSMTLWPHARKAKTFVVVPGVVAPQLMQLAERLKSEMRPYADRLEIKYRPHITLARMDPDAGRIDIPEWFPLRTTLPITHVIDRIDLIESHLHGSKDYESIAHWKLS